MFGYCVRDVGISRIPLPCLAAFNMVLSVRQDVLKKRSGVEWWNSLSISCTVSLLAPGSKLAADLARHALETRTGLAAQAAHGPWQAQAPAEVLHRRHSAASPSFCSSAARAQ